jgi:hypothetical protein
MAAETWAAISSAEFRQRYSAGGTGQDGNIDAACNIATMAVEQRIDRLLVSRGAITEYHTIRDHLSTLYLGQWPLITLTSVHESLSTPPVYDATTLLVENTGFEKVDGQKLRRLSSGSPSCWAHGNRTVKVVYTAGYASTSVVPWDLKHVVYVVAASIFGEADRKRFGVSAATDAQGNYQRFQGYFTPELEAMLEPYKRRDAHRTWELAA